MKPMKESRDIVPDIIIAKDERQNTNKLNFKKCDKIQLTVILLLWIKEPFNIFIYQICFSVVGVSITKC